MFIVKLEFDNLIKKFKFKDEYKDLNTFKQVIQDITKYDDFRISFIDLENEKIYLEDFHDMEYFMAQSEEQQRRLIVEPIGKQIENELIEIENSQEINEQQDLIEIENDQQKLKEELKELKLSDIQENQNIEQDDQIPKIYQQNNRKVKKIDWQKSKKKIKKNKDKNKSKIQELKNTLKKTKKKFKKMSKLIKQIEQEQKQNKQYHSKTNKSVEQQTEPQIKYQSEQSSVKVLTQHIGYVCNKCNQGPIVGIRYHCIVCADYDLCERCDQQSHHSHPMVRLINQQTKQQLEETLNSYLDTEIIEKEQDDDLQQKIELLNFIFPVKDKLVQRELANRYKHLNLQEFYIEISNLVKMQQ